MPKKHRFFSIAFWAVILLYIAYAAVYISTSVFEYEGTPYFGLFDDALISMQYARNLAQGHGLVWMPGDRPVEGFSNPLWVLYMALFHLLPIPDHLISLPIQITGGLLMVATLGYIRKIAAALQGEENLAGLAAVFLVAFYYPVTNWSLLGTEVSALVLVAAVTVWLVIRQMRETRFLVSIYLLLAAALWIRLDALVLAVTAWGFLVLADAPHRWRHLGWGGAILAASLLVQTGLRYAYFGDVLPNTYYLKVAGGNWKLTLQRGVYTFAKFVWNLNVILFLFPLLLLLFRRDKPVWFLFAVVWAHIAYSIWVGGDAWEHRGGANRFIAVGMPQFLLLFALAAGQVRLAVQARMLQHEWGSRPRRAELLSQGVMVVFVLLSLLNLNTLLDLTSLPYIFLRKPPALIGTSKTVTLAHYVRKITTPAARILVISAGGIPYFSGRYCYDMLGKADPVIARGPMHMPDGVSLVDWRPGHNKWDYDYSIRQLKPDVITELWWQVPWQQVPEYLKDYSAVQVEELKLFLPKGILYVRTDSPNIRWDLIQPDIVPKE